MEPSIYDLVKDPEERLSLPCLCCGKSVFVKNDSYEAQGVFNVFCDGDCEDLYAARL